MKTLIASLLLALSATTLSVAADDKTNTTANVAAQSAVYPNANATKLHVIVAKPEGGFAQIRLLDQQGRTLYTQTLSRKHQTIHTTFDMSELLDGSYSVEITNGGTTEVKAVSLKTSVPTSVATRTIAMR